MSSAVTYRSGEPLPTSYRENDPGDEKGPRKLSVITGLAGLALDAMASVAYGPEAIVIVLAAAGGAGLGFTLPVTLAIAGLLGVLVLSYRQVIAAYPNGGGAYAVAKARLGRRSSLTAAASLIIDYILNVAVSIAAGVAALTSAFPTLLQYTMWIALGVLAAITVLNLRGIAESARVLMVPTVVFIASIFAVIIMGLVRSEPVIVAEHTTSVTSLQTVGILLLLKAFSSGCAALTGVEAIANAVPNFKKPRVRNAQRAEVALGVLLGVMLIGLAVLIDKFSIAPEPGTTVLSQLTEASLGDGIGYYVVQFATVILLALAANTSYGGLPNLMRILADDNCLPHRFALRTGRDVYRYGVLALGISAAILLIASRGNMNALVPLFAIGVFFGFTLAQFGMVKHWLAERSSGWRWRAALNGVGAVLTFLAAIVTTLMKFADGAWVIVLMLPVLVVLMQRIRAAYQHIDDGMHVGTIPPQPIVTGTRVVVPVAEVSELSRRALSSALSLGTDVTALHVCSPDESTAEFTAAWQLWHPDVRLVLIEERSGSVPHSIVAYVRANFAGSNTVVVVAELDPAMVWHKLLPSHRADELATLLRRHTDAMVCHLAYRIPDRSHTE